jgi:hypothetical protein
LKFLPEKVKRDKRWWKITANLTSVQVKFLSPRCRGESIFHIGETDYQTDETGVNGGNLEGVA